jgi:hypothetical protein
MASLNIGSCFLLSSQAVYQEIADANQEAEQQGLS